MYAPAVVQPGQYTVLLVFEGEYDLSHVQSEACGTQYECLLVAKGAAEVVAGSLQVGM